MRSVVPLATLSARPQPVSEPVCFKSSHSGGNATECVEAAFVPAGVLVRDSKVACGPHLSVSADAWSWFVSASLRRPTELPAAGHPPKALPSALRAPRRTAGRSAAGQAPFICEGGTHAWARRSPDRR
ncbi:DUF397 domain-containing protein [Streptomyces sp. NPDC000658]|uniref:DUF397 domain-containing protein n=1 Tax=Streptomyces sp. NPDC000658 TaxID=3154266 RepID=UPI0033193459